MLNLTLRGVRADRVHGGREVGVGHPADVRVLEDAVSVEHHRRGKRRAHEGVQFSRQLALPHVEVGWVDHVVLREERADHGEVHRLVEGDEPNVDTIVLPLAIELDELGKLLSARPAPGRPEVEDDDLRVERIEGVHERLRAGDLDQGQISAGACWRIRPLV